MGECTSKEWGKGKKKMVKKKLTRAEVESLIPRRPGMTASEAAGATDVIMAAMEDVSTSWEVHDDDKFDRHEDQSSARKDDEVKRQDVVTISTRIEVPRHNLEEVIENVPPSSDANAQLDKEKDDHPVICTTASSSQRSESLIESNEYVQDSDSRLSDKKTEIKSDTLLAEYLAAQQTFEKLSTNAPQDPEHRNKEIIEMIHSTGLLGSVNKRIQDLLQLQLQSDTQVIKEQDMNEWEREQMKESLTIGGSTQQMSKSYIVNLQKALQLIQLREATETEHQIGPKDPFAPKKVNTSECCGTSQSSSAQEIAHKDTNSNLKQKILTEAKLASLESLTVANRCELKEKLVNAGILQQEQIKEVESISNPGESDSHTDGKAENSHSIEEKDFSPIPTEDSINKETTPITDSGNKTSKVSDGELTWLSEQELISDLPKTKNGNNTDSMKTKQTSLNIALDSVNTRSNASLQSNMEEEAKCMCVKEATSIQTLTFPQDAVTFEKDKIENGNPKNPKRGSLEIDESSKTLSQALPIIIPVRPNEDKLNASPSTVCTQSEEESVISNPQNDVMLEQHSTSKEPHNMIKTLDYQEVQVTESIYKTGGGSKEDQKVDTNIEPGIYNEPKLSENITNVVEQNEVSSNETQSSVHNEIAVTLATTRIETDVGQKELAASSKLDSSIAVVDREQKQKEILIGDIEEEKCEEKIQQQLYPAEHIEAVMMTQTLSLNQDSDNSIVAVNNTSKHLPADDDQYQQLAEKTIQESMSDMKNELLVPEGSFTQAAQKTYLSAPILEDAMEVSAFDRSTRTNENTSKNIEIRNNNVFQGMSNTAPELFQQSHTITAVVEMNNGNKKCTAEKELELEEVKIDSGMVNENDEAETFRSEEKKLDEDSLPQAPIISSIDGCETSKSSLLIEFPSKKESVAILQRQTEDEAHPKELAKELALHTRSKADAEILIDTTSLTEEVRKVTIRERDLSVLTDQEGPIRSPTEMEVQVIQPTGISSTSSIDETATRDRTENPISSLEFQTAEHALISQEGKDKNINQIKYINKDDGGFKQALDFEIKAAQNVDTPENANRLSSDENRLVHVPEVNKNMPTQEEDAARIQNSTSISLDQVIVSDDLTSEEMDKIDQDSVTESFESPDIKLNSQTGIDSVEALQTMNVATDNDLQEINESTIHPMQHGESTVNESSPVLCDMPIITDGATTDECIDGEGTNESSPTLELPILTDKEDGYVVKKIGQTEECQVQQVKIYDDIERMNNTGTALSQQAEAIKHAQMSPKENSAASSHVAVSPVPDAKESEAVSTFNQGAMTRDSYPAIDTGDNDLLGIPNTVPFLSRQTKATQYEQMLCTKDSLVVTYVTEIVKEAANMTTESPRDLKPSFDEQETLSSLQTDEYNITMPIPEVEASKAISAFDTGKMADKDSSLVIERGYNDLLGANETGPILVQPVEPTQHEKTLSIEDAVIMNHFPVGIGEAIQSDTMEKARYLQLSINREEVASSHETDKSNLMVQNQDIEATGAISYFYASGITDKNNSPVIESGNYMLQGMTNTTTVLDQQAELASQQKILFEEEAIVVTHVSPRTEKETSSDILDSTRSLQLPSEEEDASSSHETDEFELVSLPEDTTPGAAQTFDIGEVTYKDSSPVIETGNNKLIVMTNAVDDLVAQTEAVEKEQTSSTDDSKVVTRVASGIEKETASKTLEPMEASQIPFEEKETSNSYYIDTSHLPVPIPQSAEYKVPAFDTGVMAGERISPSTETRNDDSQRLTADLLVPTSNPPCLDHQIEATLDQKISSIEAPVGGRNPSLGTEMESVSENIESTRNLQLSFNPEESWCEGDRPNPDITITEVEAPEATSEFDPVAMTDKNTFPVIELENYDSLGMTHTKTGLVQQDGDDLLKQISHVEDSKVVTQVSAEIAKGTSSETLQSTGDLQLPLEEKEISKLHRNEKSSLMVKIPRVEEEDASRSHATDKSDLTVPILQVDEEDTSHASGTDESKLIIPIQEDVSTSDIGADAHEDGSLARETGNKKLGGDTNPVPALVPQEEVTLNGQMSSTDNSVVVPHAATEVQTETANETAESTGDLQHSFEKEEDSISYDIDKPNLAVPTLEVEATESVSAIVTDAITENENTPDKQTRSDDSVGLTDNLPVLTNIKPALVRHTDNIQNEQILSVQDTVVDKASAAMTENETMSEPTESTGDFEFKFKDEESLHEIDKSNITFPIPEVKESEAVPASEAVTVTDEIIIPDIQSENNDFLGMANTETALAQQDGSSLLEQMSNVENSMVVTQVSAGYGKETSCETLESTRDLRISAEEKEASSLHESDKSSQLFPNPQAEELDASSLYKTDKYVLMAPIPEDTSEIISTFDIGSEADKDTSPTMKMEIDKLKEVTNTVPALVAQAEVALDKEASATDNLIVVNQVTTGIDEGAANGTHQSGGDEQLPFREEEASNSYYIYKFNLAVPIQKLEPTEAISAFNTVDMICGESSPATETSSDDSPATNDSLVPTNIKPDLVQKTEATLDEQMSSIKVPVAEMQDTAANVKETASEIPKPTEDLQPSIGENESMSEIDESNITVPLSEVEESVAATAFQTDAVTDNFTVSGIQSENIDLLRMNNIETALVQQNGATLIEQKSSVEDSKVLTQVSTGIGKETASETLESTKDLQLAGQENKTSSQIDKFTITIPFSEVEDLEADEASEIDTMTHKFITPVVQSENDNLLPITNNKTALVQQDRATLFQQISCTENSIVLPEVSAEIGKETSSDIRVSTKDLQLSVDDKETSNSHESNKSSQMFHIPDAQEKLSLSSQEIEKFELISLIPEDTASEADSTFGIRAEVNKEDSPTMKTGTNNLVGVTNTVSALVAQAEVTLIDQKSATDDSIVVTQVAAGIEEESSSENSQSMEDLQISFDEKEASNSYDDKSSLKVSIIEVEQTEAVSIFHRVVTIDEESSPVIETRNDDSLGVTANLLAQQAEPIQHEQISTIELSEVESETHEATGTKKGTATETPESIRDFKFSIEQEESLREKDKSNISVPISKIEAFEAVPAIEMIAMTDNIVIPVGKSENNNLIEMSNTETALVHQDQATILEEMSCLKDSMVLTQVPARIGEETSSGTFESTNDLQPSVEQKEASSFHESDKSSQTFGTSEAEEENSWSSQETEKSKLMVSIPEDITSKVVSADDTFVEAYQGSSPAMETGDNKLMGVMNTEPVQVAGEEITLNAQISNKDDSIVGAQATGINEETASGTFQSMQELDLSFDDKTGSKSFDFNKSYLVVPITEIEETEVVPTFHTVATTHEDSSPLIASRNDDSLRFTDDLLVPTSTELNLVQQSGPIQHEQMSSIKEVETYDATENSQETVSGIPESSRELSLSSEQKESLCKIGESNISAPIPKVDALKAAPALEMTAMTDNIIIPFGESENDDLIERSDPENSLVRQDPAILLDKISCVEDSVVVTNESAGIGKETTSKISASTRGLQPSFEKREASIFCESNESSQMVQIPKVEEEDTLNSQENDKSELVIQFPEDTTLQSVSTIDIDADVDWDESTSMDTENNNLEGVINTEPALAAQTETTTLNEQTLSIDDTVLTTQVAAGIEEETVSETPQLMGYIQPLLQFPESSRELSLSSEQKESLCKSGESNISAPISKVDALEAAPALEMTTMTDNIIIPFGESEIDDLLERSNPENSLVRQDPAILLDKISCVENSVVVTNESAGIEKETTSKISASTRGLQPSFEKREASIFCESNESSQMVQIPKVEEEDPLNSQENDKSELVIQFPEDTTLQSVSTIDIDAEVDQDESTSMDTEDNNLEGVINTEPALVAQTETTTLNEQTLSIDDTVLATQVAAGIEEETVSETPQLMGYIQPLFAEKSYSHSYDNYKSNAAVPILEVEVAEAVSAIDMCAMTHEKSSPIIEIKNDDTLELTDDSLLLNNTQPPLIPQTEAAPNEQIPWIENLVVETHDATVTKKETMRETPRSARDLKPPFKQEESLCEIDKFNITVPNPEVEALEADSAFKMISGMEKKSSPVEESENKKLLEMSNTKIAPIHQDKAALLDLICAEDLMVVTSVSAGTEKDTSSEVPNSTKDLQLSVVEKKASSLYESDKSSQIVQIPEVEENDTILAVSTINIAAETERNDSLAIQNENKKLVGVIKTVPILVAQTETAVNEKTPYTDESVIETQVAAGIEEQIVYEPLPSMENLQLSFEEGETSESYDIVKSNLEVPTPEVEAKEAVSAFHTDAMTHEKGSPIIETRNDGTLELTDDLLLLTNTETGLIQQAKSTLDEQMPSLEESLVETHNATGTAEETVRATPGSIKDLQFSFGHEESLCEINRFNTTAPPPVVEVLEATPPMEMIAVTDSMIIPDGELENNKLIEISNTETTLIHQDMATHLDQISCVEDSIVVTDISAEIGKDTSSKVAASTRDLEISVEEKEAASSLNTSAQMVPSPENDKSRFIVQNTTAPPPVVEVLEAAPAMEMIAVTDKVIIPHGELENNKIIEISNPETTLIQQDMATHLDQISCVEHSIVLTDISAEIGKDTSSKIAASTRDLDISVEEKEATSSLNASAQMVPIPENDKSRLTVQIPEDTTLGVMSTIHIAAGSDQNDSPVVENDKDILVGMISTMCVSVLQTEATLNEQTSSIDDSMTKTQVSADIEEETERETQSMGNVQLSVKDEKTSHSYDIGKSNLEVPIPEVKPTEAVLSFDTDAMTHRECSPLIKIMNDNTLELKDDLLVLTNTQVALVQHTEGNPHEQMPVIEVSLVETHDATGTEKETVSEAPGSTRDLQLLLKQEERLCETDESNITFPIPEVKALEPASAFEMISTDKTTIHVGQSENNDLLGKSNIKTTLLEKISSVEDSMVVTHVSEGIGKKASSETSYSTRDLDLPVGEKRISSLHESDESSQTVPIPEDTKIEAESTFAMFAKADHNIASDMGTENNKSVEVTKAVPALVAEADANLNEQISSINDPIAVTEVASQIQEGTASEILQSVEDLQLLFEKKEASSPYDIDKSNLAVLIPEAVSAFNTEAETNNERSSVKETTNNDPLELIDDCLPMTNTEPTLVKQNEDTVRKQMSPIEESVFERRDAAETEKETVTVDPESTGDLQLSLEQEEGMCETDKSNIAISKAEIEPSETDPFEMAALSDKINIPIKKSNSKNGDLLEMTNMETALTQQDGATLFKKTYCVEDSMVATYDPAEMGKGSSNEIPESTRYLQIPVDEEEKSSLHESGRFSQMVQLKKVEEEDATSSSKLIVLIPEDAKLGAVSNFDISAEADRDSCPAMETQNNKLVGVANTVPPLVTQAKITLNEQTSNLDDSIVVTTFASGIEEETARETPQSMGDAPFEENEASNSCNTDKSNLLALIPEAEAAGVPSFDTDAKTHKESSPGIETRNDDPLELINDHQVLNKTAPALVQQAEATLQEQMSYTEEPIVETHIDVMTEKKTVTKNTESTGNLQPSLRQEEVVCKIDTSSIVVSVPEVAPSETVPFEMVAVTEKISVPVKESKNNDLSEMTDTETGLVQRDETPLSEQMSCIEDSMVVTYITAEVGKETSSEIPESTRDIQTAIKDVEAPSLHESGKSSLQAQITDVEEEDTSSTHMIDESELMFETPKSISEAASTFNIDAGADLGGSPDMETENKKLAGMTSTLSALVAHAETTLNEQLSFIDDSVNAAQIDTAIKKEIASETPQSMGDLKLSFEEKEASTSYDINKSDLVGSIPEVEAREAFCTFDTEATSFQKSSPVIKTRNDDPLELTGDLQIATNTKPALAQNIDAILHEQTKSIENPVVGSHIAAATEKETVTENPESTRDLHISLNREERLCEVDKSNITVPAPEFEASEAAPFESISVPDKIFIPVIESKNNDLLEMNNTKTALVQQDGATLFEQNVCVDSMVVKYISSETEKETSNEIPESTKDSEASNLHESDKPSLQVQIPDAEENDAVSSHEIDKYESMVLIPEDTTSEAVAAFDIDVGADRSNSPAMESENNKLVEAANTVPSLATQAEIALYEQTSSVTDSIVVPQFATAIEEETATETPQSIGDIEVSFKEEEARETVSTFDTVLMSHVKSSPVIEPRNEDSVELPNDLLVLTNTNPALVQKAEAALHDQMLTIEDSVVDKHTAAATENDTSESTEDLQLPMKDVLCEIDKSRATVAVPEVEATEAVPEFNALAVPEIKIIPVTESEKNGIPRMANTEIAPVQLDGASLLEQMSHGEDPMVVTHDSAGI